MEKSATLNLRVNPTLKSDAETILSRLGIPMSTAVDMFLNQVVLVGGILDYPTDMSMIFIADINMSMDDIEQFLSRCRRNRFSLCEAGKNHCY